MDKVEASQTQALLERVRKRQNWDQMQLEGWVALLHSPQAQVACLSELQAREERLIASITQASGSDELFRLQGELKSTRDITRRMKSNIEVIKGAYDGKVE